MSIPSLDSQMKFVDEHGKLTDSANLLMTQLLQSLQKTLSNEGHVLPAQSASNIIRLNTPLSVGNILFNRETGKTMINNSGTFVNVATE